MFKRLLLVLIFSQMLSSCNEDHTQLPDILVDEWVYLNNSTSSNLASPGGWIYIDGGIRGIIVYYVGGNQYRAYERSCPHISPNNCSTSNVENDILVVCPCDNSKFLLNTGEPIDGAPNALKQYTVIAYGDQLHIVN